MVAYSFKRRFVEPIQIGTKTHTIRGARKRHAMPGERLQLFHGMRTRHCEKILPDPVCLSIDPIRMFFRGHVLEWVRVADDLVRDLQDFARADGFKDAGDLANFWELQGGETTFNGVLISWTYPDFGLHMRSDAA